MGDSITENYTWPTLIGDRSGAIVTKGGFGGTRLTEMTRSLAGMCGVDIADAIQSGDWGPMEAAAAEAGKALCAARGQALSEWSFGFSSLVPNLLVAEWVVRVTHDNPLDTGGLRRSARSAR